MSYRTEEILRDLESGRISDYEAKSALEREYGSCSCMRSEIERTVRDVEYGYRDSFSSSRNLDSAEYSCQQREREEREEERRQEERQERQRYERQQSEFDQEY